MRLSSDLSQLIVGEEVFTIGDLVVLFSVLSQESFSGVITAISHRYIPDKIFILLGSLIRFGIGRDVIVRTGTGARLAFLVGQVRNGTVTVSKDLETIRNAQMVRQALALKKDII